MNLDSNINCENKDLFLKMHKTLSLLLTKLFACHIPNRNPDKGVVIGSFEHHAKKNVGGGKKISHILILANSQGNAVFEESAKIIAKFVCHKMPFEANILGTYWRMKSRTAIKISEILHCMACF